MARPLKVGIQLPEVERDVRWSELREMAQTAEGIGIDSIWVGDHLLYRTPGWPSRGPWEAWSLLAALASATRRVELGPLVACVGFHNPAVLAKTAATVDDISGGRLVLGLGAGWNQTEFDAFGVPYDHRVSRFADAFAIIRGLLADGHVDHRGEWHSAPDCELLPRPTRAGGPPLLIGSTGARMLEITLPHVSRWNAWYRWYGNTVDGYRARRGTIDDACVAAGRDPAEIERSIAVLVRFPGGHGRPSGDPAPEPDPISGDPEVLVPTLRAFAAEGVGHVQLVLDPNTLESVVALEPTLRALDAG